MNTIAIGEKGLWKLICGANDLEKRDRQVGLTFTLIGLLCMFALPEAEVARQHFTGNSPDTDLIYYTLFIGSFLTFIGPCLMLPYRYGALPMVTAILWSVLQVHGVFTAESSPTQMASADTETSRQL